MAMKRLYFLVPDIAGAQRLVDALLLARIESRHLHVLAKRDTPLQSLPEAGLLQKTDFVPAVQRGIALGGATGIVAGLIAVGLRLAAPSVAGGLLLFTALAGAGVGSWLGGMAGMSLGNTRLRRFGPAIERGELLVMVDVPRNRVSEIEDLVKERLADVRVEGIEPLIPAFP